MGIRAPSYTQMPNELIDEWLPKLKLVELRVLMVILRKTFGWRKTYDRISLSQLQKLTGSRKEDVIFASLCLEKMNLIRKVVCGEPGHQSTYYELVIEEPSSNLYQSESPTTPQSEFPTPPSRNFRPTKETLTKEKKSSNRKKPTETAAASIEDQIRESKIPSDQQENAIQYYKAYKEVIDKKDNPVGWVVKMWEVGKIDSLSSEIDKRIKVSDIERENKGLSYTAKKVIENEKNVSLHLDDHRIRIDFSDHRISCGGKFDSIDFKKDLLGGLIRAELCQQVFVIVDQWDGPKNDSIFNKIQQMRYVASSKARGYDEQRHEYD